MGAAAAISAGRSVGIDIRPVTNDTFRHIGINRTGDIDMGRMSRSDITQITMTGRTATGWLPCPNTTRRMTTDVVTGGRNSGGVSSYGNRSTVVIAARNEIIPVAVEMVAAGLDRAVAGGGIGMTGGTGHPIADAGGAHVSGMITAGRPRVPSCRRIAGIHVTGTAVEPGTIPDRRCDHAARVRSSGSIAAFSMANLGITGTIGGTYSGIPVVTKTDKRIGVGDDINSIVQMRGIGSTSRRIDMALETVNIVTDFRGIIDM